jgi:hypothetical protein
MDIDRKYDRPEECTKETRHQCHIQWNKQGI